MSISGGQTGVQSGGSIQTNSLTLQTAGTIDVGGTLDVGGGGLNITGGQLTSTGGGVNLTGAGQLLANSGIMQLANTSVTAPGAAILDNLPGGMIQMAGGSMGGTVQNSGLMQLSNTVGMNTLNIGSTGTVDVQAGLLKLQNDMQVLGTLTNTLSNMATIQHQSAQSLVFNLFGSEVSGNLELFGDINGQSTTSEIRPGNPVGQIIVHGDYSQNGSLFLDLGGTTAVTEYDVLSIDGSAVLAGALNVSFLDLGSGLFSPTLGDTFDVLSAETITGGFGSLNLADPGAGLAWSVAYLTDAIGTIDVVRLSVAVPAPPATLLLGIALVALVRSKRAENPKA